MFTAAEIREYGNLANNEVSDLMLSMMEKRIVKLIENETGSYFGEIKQEVSLINGSGKNFLWLPYNVARNSLDSVSLIRYAVQNNRSILFADPIFNNNFDSIVDFSQEIVVEWKEISKTNCALKFGRKLIRIGNVFPTAQYIIEVTYDVGFEPGSEPDDIKLIVMSAIGLLVTSKGKEGLSSLSDQNTKATFSFLSKNIPFWDETISNNSVKSAFTS